MPPINLKVFQLTNFINYFYQVNPSENLPQQICDLCIVQLNVSYNFKRLALKNDFQIRNYMLENGINLTKDDDHIETTTALEIHQIQHNVIRTNRYRSMVHPEIRRNSTQSSVSGTSTMIINNQNDMNGNAGNNFVTPRPMVRPIQIKIEPVDEEVKEASPVTTTSSPSIASELASVVTINSSNAPTVYRPPPMIVINGIVNNDSFSKTSIAAPLSVKLGRHKSNISKPADKQIEISQNSRVIKKKNEVQNVKKLRNVVKVVEAKHRADEKRMSPRKHQELKNQKAKAKAIKFKIVDKARKGDSKSTKQANVLKKPRGRPPKSQNNSKQQKGKEKS